MIMFLTTVTIEMTCLLKGLRLVSHYNGFSNTALDLPASQYFFLCRGARLTLHRYLHETIYIKTEVNM